MAKVKVVQTQRLDVLSTLVETGHVCWRHKGLMVFWFTYCVLALIANSYLKNLLRGLDFANEDAYLTVRFWVVYIVGRLVFIAAFAVFWAALSRKIYTEGRHITLGRFRFAFLRCFAAYLLIWLGYILVFYPVVFFLLAQLMMVSDYLAPNGGMRELQFSMISFLAPLLALIYWSRFALLPSAASIYDHGGFRAGWDAAKNNTLRLATTQIVYFLVWLLVSALVTFLFVGLVGINPELLNWKGLVSFDVSFIREGTMRENIVLNYLFLFFGLVGLFVWVVLLAVAYRRLALDGTNTIESGAEV